MTEQTGQTRQTRRTWKRAAGTAAVAAAALTATVTPSAAAPVETRPAAAPVAAAAADVDYDTWQRDCRAVMDQALPYLKERIADAAPGEKQAIVLDIDNTALETDFGFSYPQPANRPVLEAARYAQEHGVALFFVPTARPGLRVLRPVRPRLHRPVPERRRVQDGTARRDRVQGLHDHRTSATAPPTCRAATPRRRSSSRTTTASCPDAGR